MFLYEQGPGGDASWALTAVCPARVITCHLTGGDPLAGLPVGLIRKMGSWLGRGDQIFFRAKQKPICLTEQERTKSKRSLTLQRG